MDLGNKSVKVEKDVSVVKDVIVPAVTSDSAGEETSTTVLTGAKLWIVFSSLLLAFSLVALDATIISTALPTIASHFQAVNDLSWIAGGYFIPQAAFMLFYGKVLSFCPAKLVFLTSIAIFEIGSLFCAVSPSVEFLIFGRAVAGLGAAGLWVTMLSIIAQITTLRERPVMMGLFGAVYAVSSIIGPLLGGVFAEKVSWRWCFYINLPIGGLAIFVVIIALPYAPAPDHNESSLLQRWIGLDWIGTLLSVGMTVMLVLPLQWGGSQKPWNDPAIIATLVLFAVFLVFLIFWEYKQGPDAILPLRLLSTRSMIGACIEAFMVNMGFILANYYLPFLYQIRGHSAARSGIDIIPFLISAVVASIICGGLVTVLGWPWPFLFCGPMMSAVSFGLLFTITGSTSFARMAGYQILTGIGLGQCIQTLVVTAQVIFADQEAVIPQASALITFMQIVGSSIGLAAAQAVFSDELRHKIAILAPNLSAETKEAILSSVEAVFNLPESEKGLILEAYTSAITKIFIIGIPTGGLAVLASLLISKGRIQNKALEAI